MCIRDRSLLGKLAEHQDQWQEALELHKRAIAVNTEMHGAKDESVGSDSLNIGHCLHRLGREIEAIPHAARAERIFGDALGRDHSKTKLARSAIENWRA